MTIPAKDLRLEEVVESATARKACLLWPEERAGRPEKAAPGVRAIP